MDTMNAKQAARYLEVTPYQVIKLVRSKKLIDLGITADNKHHHQFVIPKESLDNYKEKSNGHRPKPQYHKVVENKAVSFIQKLNRIEAKLDKLINMWS